MAQIKFVPCKTPLRQRSLPSLNRQRAPDPEGLCLPQDTARKYRRWDLNPGSKCGRAAPPRSAHLSKQSGMQEVLTAASGSVVVPVSLGEGPRQVRLRASWGDTWPRAPRSPREKTGLSVQHKPPLLQPSQRGVQHSEDPGKDRHGDSASKPGLCHLLARRPNELREGTLRGNGRRAQARGRNRQRWGSRRPESHNGRRTRNERRLPL